MIVNKHLIETINDSSNDTEQYEVFFVLFLTKQIIQRY